MAEIIISFIEAKDNRITFGVKRQEGDEKAYKEFLKTRGLIDINGETCYQEITPKDT